MIERNSKIKEMINTRKARGMIFLEQGFEPKQIKPKMWIVPSQTGNGTYTVTQLQTCSHWKCTCPDHELRNVPCKHIQAVKIWSKLSHRFEQSNLSINQNIQVIDDEEICACKHCHSSNFIKYGKANKKQVYYCKDCKRTFVNNIDFENLKYHPKIIALTLDLYFRGLSLRKISQHLKEFYDLDVTHVSIYN